MSSVSTLVDQLKTAQGAALQKLLYELAVQLSGDTSDALRAELRGMGAVAVISKLLTHEAKQIHQLAINIAGSLAATALDPQAGLSNSLLKQAGAFDHLLRHLLTTKDDTTLLYALIAIQNMCVEIEYVNELKAAGGVKRLQHIAGQTDPQLRQFAQGCLDNARTVVAIDAMQQKAVKSTPKTRAEAGKYLAHAYVRRWRARQGVRQGVRPSSVALQASLVHQLKNDDDATLVKLLYSVAMQLDDASGESAISLCAELRASGAVAVISNLIAHGSSQIHRLAISIIGNLASTALDPQAGLSNGLLKQAGAFDHLLRHLFSTDQGVMLLTVVAIQNMCVEIEYVNKLKAAGGIKRLQHIVGQTDPQLRQFAQGCLDNARTVVVIDAMQQKVSRTKNKAEAVSLLEAFSRRWRARRAAAVTAAAVTAAPVAAAAATAAPVTAAVVAAPASATEANAQASSRARAGNGLQPDAADTAPFAAEVGTAEVVQVRTQLSTAEAPASLARPPAVAVAAVQTAPSAEVARRRTTAIDIGGNATLSGARWRKLHRLVKQSIDLRWGGRHHPDRPALIWAAPQLARPQRPRRC